MGRSPRFCFSIKACSGASADDSKPLEVKASPEKKRWSFRRKSVGHHAPRNTIISEPVHTFSENQYQESTSDILYSEKSPSEPEKACIVEETSSALISPLVSSRAPNELTSTTAVRVDHSIPDPVVIVIQTSIRGCLAKMELQKLKNVVKLQALARGYLVRRQAAGTLRCILAIVKMQGLVRARRSVESSNSSGKNKVGSMPVDVMSEYDMERNKRPSAIRMSVSSSFARQLLESTPKTKPIHISCDPSRPASAWSWLERWMTLTSISHQNLILNKDDMESSRRVELTPIQESVNMENDKYLSVRGAKEGPDYIFSQMQQPLDASLQFKLDVDPNKFDFTEDNYKNSGRKGSNCAQESGRKAVNGSRKSLDSAFAAAQTKFEELSSSPDSITYSDLASRDAVSVSKSALSQINFASIEVNATKSVHTKLYSKLQDVSLNEKLNNPNPEGHGASSEHGIGIYVSSLDRPEAATSEFVPKIRTFEEINLGVKSIAEESLNFKDIKTEIEKNGAISIDSVERMQVEKHSMRTDISCIQIQNDDTDGIYADRRSLIGSPRSHSDFADTPMTPSSQKFLRVQISKAETNISARKKSQIAVKNSPTSSKSDSNSQSNGKHSQMDTKNVMRPNSSGTDKASHVGHKDRSNINSLPNYMQHTESTKAKFNTSFYQKPNTGLHHNDDHIRKRQSLPIVNAEQGSSPWVQSSTSQIPQILKGSGISSHNTERRLQI